MGASAFSFSMGFLQEEADAAKTRLSELSPAQALAASAAIVAAVAVAALVIRRKARAATPAAQLV